MNRLAGRRILITRPAGLADRLAALIRSKGGEAVLFPAMMIVPPADRRALASVIEQLHLFDIAVFVSPTAVARANEAVTAQRGWPDGLRFAAVGRGTASALHGLGIQKVIAPEAGSGSEALLELAEFSDVKGMAVVIFRGEGGRDVMRETLESRGARVIYAQCYRRVRPAADPAPLLAQWAQGGIHAVSVTSAEGLQNLVTMLGDAWEKRLIATPVFVPHPRIADAAHRMGFKQVHCVDAGDDALVDGLEVFFARV